MVHKHKSIIQHSSLLLFIFLGVCSCCKLESQPAQVNVRFEGYSFNSTDSLKVTYFRNGSIAYPGLTFFSESYYHLSTNNEFILRQYDSITDSQTVVISNDRLSVTDTLKNFVIENKTIKGGCPGLIQYYSSFDVRGRKYGLSENIDLIIKP